MAKTAKHSVALLIPAAAGRLLLVLRPATAATLPGLWSLPTTATRLGETDDDAVRRAGREKLGVDLLPGALIGEAETDNADRTARMRVREATIASGAASVPQPSAGTQYVDWRWGDPAELRAAARAGSLAAQVLLRARQLPW